MGTLFLYLITARFTEQFINIHKGFRYLDLVLINERDTRPALSPSILILDLRMPEKDGMAVLEEVDRNPLTTRIIVLTSKCLDFIRD